MKRILILLFSSIFFTSCASPNDKVVNIAHRGASAYAVEHSIEAYELALSQGADYLELDVQMTKDGVLMIEHDEFPSYGDGNTIPGYNFEQLDSMFRVSAKGTSTILTLEEVIKHFPNAPLYIETKLPQKGIEEKLVKLLKETGRLDSPSTIIFQSFSSDSLKILQNLAPDIQRFQLLTKSETKSLTDEEMKEIATYANGILSHRAHTTKRLIQRVHAASLAIHVYTVDEMEELKQLIRFGVDGIITNKPDVLHEILNN